MLGKLKPKSEFSKNVLTLMTGTTIAQAIPIAISPILTRIYTPDDFGVFALYMAVASIVSVIATGRYELAVMLPKKDDEAINIVFLSILISVIVSLLSFITIFIFNTEIVSLLGNKEISNWLYFVPLTVLLTGVYQSLNYWLNRKKKYKNLSIIKVSQSSTTATSNLTMGFNNFAASGLILSGILGQFIAIVIFSKNILKEDVFQMDKINKLKIIALVKRYIKLPKYNLPNALIDSFRLSGISILIAKYFSTASLGQFSLAWKMLQTPMSLLGSSISQVFFQKIATSEKTDLFRIVMKFLVKATIFSLPIFIFIYLFSKDLFIIFFGENWSLAGEIASVLSPWLFFNFLTAPLSVIFITLNKQEILLTFSIFYMIIPLSILYILQESSFLVVLEYVTLFMSIKLIVFIFLVLYYTKKAK